jgi:hypothetical protein
LNLCVAKGLWTVTVFFGPLDAPKITQMTPNQGVRPKVQCAFSMDVARYIQWHWKAKF